MQPAATHTLTVIASEARHILVVPHGVNLRRALVDAGLSPYAALTRQLNCGGRGLCATCGVWIEGAPLQPKHWHDRLAARFGYPRLSCQVAVTHDLTVRLVSDKHIWGRRDPTRRWPPQEGA